MENTLRPLSTGELFDSTFTLYRKHFALFFGVAALPYLLILLFQLGVLSLTMLSLGTAGIVITAVSGLLFLVVYLVSIAFTQGASFFAVSAVHLNEPITIAEAFGRMKSHIGEVIGTMMLVGLLTFLGMLALIVPGIIVALGAALAVPAALFEQLNPWDAFQRSMKLTKGHRGTVFLVYLLMWAIKFGMGLLLGVVLVLMGGIKGPGALTVGIQVVQNVLDFGLNALTAPIVSISMTLLYYDLRVRKEAFDLQHMMNVLATRQPAMQAAQAAGSAGNS
ncbi:MAG TPA: hypothetical protein VLA96_01620 [Terriglobales bacterium]|nr:hypothetical protein [Terriglobales bacterium]